MAWNFSLKSVLLIIWSTVGQKKVEESNTGALLKFPSVIDGPLYGKEWEVAPAQFGYQSYGGSIEAYLVIPMNTTYHKECPQNGKQEPLHENGYKNWLKVAIDQNDDYGFIMVIDRGDCYFVEKVEFAQKIGAKACLIIDHTPENLFTMWMPDNWNDDIDIPSVLLDERSGEILYQHLGVKNWQPKNIEGTTYPLPPVMNWTLATIEWGLPHDDDRVEWELWTSSNDPLAVKFKQNFKDISLLLDGANDTVFEPRMYLLNGNHYGCTTPPYLCGNQCTNQGRYCSVDPEFDLEIGISGADVVQENLRNLCVWNYTKLQDELEHNLNESTWWDYAVMWDSNCAFPVNASEFKFTEACSHEQMDMIDATQGLKEYVKKCINDSGGYGENDGVNHALAYEIDFREHNSVYAMPMVRVNEFLIHGNIDCEILLPSHCQVLAAVCAGFINGTKPEICFGTHVPSNAPTINPLANPSQTPSISPTYMPSLTPTSIPSASPSVTPSLNPSTTPTSFPSNDPTLRPTINPTDNPSFRPSFNPTLKPFEHCVEDECGNCKFLNDSTRNDCIGCDGIKDSGKEYNPCGKCILKTIQNFDTFGQDCQGVCDGGKLLDECGQCLLPENPIFDNCVGCDGVAYSGQINDCTGLCNGPHKLKCGKCLNETNTVEWETACNEVLIEDPTNNKNIIMYGSIAGGILLIIIIFIITCIYCVMKKQQNNLENKLKQIAGSYEFMNDDPNETNVNIKSSETKGKRGQRIQTNDDDDLL